MEIKRAHEFALGRLIEAQELMGLETYRSSLPSDRHNESADFMRQEPEVTSPDVFVGQGLSVKTQPKRLSEDFGLGMLDESHTAHSVNKGSLAHTADASEIHEYACEEIKEEDHWEMNPIIVMNVEQLEQNGEDEFLE